MIDAWDQMLADDDADLVAEIKADAVRYTTHMLTGNTDAAILIEKKYGLYGLSPQQVSEQLHAMTLPIGGLAS
jgi:hypothetical protein